MRPQALHGAQACAAGYGEGALHQLEVQGHHPQVCLRMHTRICA